MDNDYIKLDYKPRKILYVKAHQFGASFLFAAVADIKITQILLYLRL